MVDGPDVHRVGDASDARVEPYRGLRDSRARARFEADAGLFVAEGLETVRRVLASSVRVHSVFVLPRRVDSIAGAAAARGVPVLVAGADVYNGVVGFDAHRGVLALCERPQDGDFETVCRTARLAVVLEGVGDAENLGAIYRNAAAFGADAVVLDPTCTDPWARRTVRVAMGHVVGVPTVRVTAWPSALDRLRAGGVEVVATTPAGDLSVERWTPGGRTAVVFGAEGTGLRPETLALADRRVRIDMAGGVDSLNVAAATAVVLHRARVPG